MPDFARTALNIIPSGQYGGVPIVPKADDQARMYDGLTPEFDQVSTRDLNRFFKSERLGTKGQGPLTRERVPRKGLRIVRDRHNVPHIYGRTNDDVTWGAGWVLAKDRQLLLEQARFNARVAVIDAPGLSAISLITGLKTFRPSAQTEREVRKEVGKLKRYGKPGRRAAPRHRRVRQGHQRLLPHAPAADRPAPWTRSDVIALNAVKSELFGEGGGGEVDAAEMLDGLQASLGAERGLLGLERPAPAPGPGDARLDPGQLPLRAAAGQPAAATWCSTTARSSRSPCPAPDGAGASAPSSELRAPRQQRADGAPASARAPGNPLFVGGPQIGYFYPGLTLEMDLHGPGWKARGATSAPFPGYILIGRREDFVWTLTSAGADIVDIYVETLCEGSDTKYLLQGQAAAR